jgi:hypothetical protein
MNGWVDGWMGRWMEGCDKLLTTMFFWTYILKVPNNSHGIDIA